MARLLPAVDPEGLLVYSVVYTDRALNHMSQSFQGVMRDISRILKQVYHAEAAIVVPGGGTFGMEAVARQFASDCKCLVIRNGWFSFRWTQIFEMGRIPSECIVLKARRLGEGKQAPFAPPPVDEVVATILRDKPAVVFAPHVETASGMILPDSYLRAVGDAVRAVDGLFVLDCIASGAIWVDMRAAGVDVLISAPQKGWSASIGYGLLALSYFHFLKYDKRQYWLALLMAVFYAATDEYHQSFVAGRGPSVFDVFVFDSIGALIALWLYSRFWSKHESEI